MRKRDNENVREVSEQRRERERERMERVVVQFQFCGFRRPTALLCVCTLTHSHTPTYICENMILRPLQLSSF